MSDISLNAGIRSNLLQLQQSASLFNRTTERLASGKEVNTAIDNPTNFFASVNLNDRATGLETRLDGMGQAIQRIQAADNGISTIRGFVSAMKGVVNNALGNTDADARDDLGAQFNELIVQVSETAKDSGYAGINLLERNETETVQFNETFDASVLNVQGFDIQGPGSDGRGRVVDGTIEAAGITAVVEQASRSAVSAVTGTVGTVTNTGAVTVSTAAQASASISGYNNTGASASSVTATGTLYAATAASASTIQGTSAVASATGTQVGSTAATVTQATQASRASRSAGTATANVGIALDTQNDDAVGIQGAGTGSGMIDWGGDNYKEDLAAVVVQLEQFDEALKSQASDLAQNLATITTREEFSNELINTLTEGADKLTLADLNEEGANLLALQTSQQLATQSLSLASQQSQQVLQLLG